MQWMSHLLDGEFSEWLLLNILAKLIWTGSINPMDGTVDQWWRWMENPNPTQSRWWSDSVTFKSDLLPIEFFKFSSHFSLVVADQYLFIFDKLEEDNICLVYNFPFRQTCHFVFSEPSVSETRSSLVGQVFHYCFNEFTTKITQSFSCLESLKMDEKETPTIPYRAIIP